MFKSKLREFWFYSLTPIVQYNWEISGKQHSHRKIFNMCYQDVNLHPLPKFSGEHSSWKRNWCRLVFWGLASFEPKTPYPSPEFLFWFTLIWGIINFGWKLAKKLPIGSPECWQFKRSTVWIWVFFKYNMPCCWVLLLLQTFILKELLSYQKIITCTYHQYPGGISGTLAGPDYGVRTFHWNYQWEIRTPECGPARVPYKCLLGTCTVGRPFIQAIIIKKYSVQLAFFVMEKINLRSFYFETDC